MSKDVFETINDCIDVINEWAEGGKIVKEKFPMDEGWKIAQDMAHALGVEITFDVVDAKTKQPLKEF